MANEIRKYLSLTGLQNYDAQVKARMEAADEAALKAAKEYADDLADNYDAAGTAQTKVNELTEGQVKTNKEAIDAINNGETGILKQANDYTDGKHNEALAAAGAASDAAAEAKEAADAAQEAADAAQADYDALVDETEGSKGRIPVLEGKVEALIAGTYDDTEVRGLIKTNADDIDALEERAQATEDIIGVLVGDDADKSVRTIANEELAKQLIPENAAEALNELQEIAAWIQAHPGDAAAMNKAITDLTALVGTLPEGVTATTVVGYIDSLIAGEKNRAEQAEGALSDRLDAVEDLLGGEGEDTVDARIAAAKTAAVTEANGYTDGKVKDLADGSVKANTDAIAKLNGGETEDGSVAKAIKDAKDAIGADVTGVSDRVTDIENSLATGGATANAIKAAQDAADAAQADVDALTAENGKVTVLEGKVAALESIEWVEISTNEIAAMFA